MASHRHQYRQLHSEEDHREWEQDMMPTAMRFLSYCLHPIVQESASILKGINRPILCLPIVQQISFFSSLKANAAPGIMRPCLSLVSFRSKQTHQNSLVSPMAQVSNNPVSGIPLVFIASFNNLGGSSTSSMVNTHVPQWIAMAFLHLVSLKISTAS